MSVEPLPLARLLEIVGSARAVEDLRSYFEPDLPPARMPVYSRSRFDFLAGGGDSPETVDRVTADDLVAVSLLTRGVPGDVALDLLEGGLGRHIAWSLQRIPADLGIDEPAAVEHVESTSFAGMAQEMLEELPGMDAAIASALLARKRPQLLPACDRVVRCAYGRPGTPADWLSRKFEDEAGRLGERLLAARDEAGAPRTVPALRILDVIVWMRHGPVHLENGCPGLI